MTEADRLNANLYGPAHTLMAIKRTFGADMVRKLNVRTDLADEEYGPEWLDRDDEGG